jgi:hypothetical protein
MRTRKTSDITIAWPVRMALELAVVLDTDEELEDVPEDGVGVATGTTTVVEAKVWVDTAADAEDPDADDADAEVGELGLAAATTNGLEELPPVPDGRLNVAEPIVVCCKRFAEVSVESIGSPVL